MICHRFRPGWRLTLAVALLIPAMIALGFWQLGRAETKRGLESTRYLRMDALPVTESELLRETEPDFLRVALSGSYVEGEYFLLDNQVSQGIAGYRVIQSFRSLDGNTFLIERGWVRAETSRQQLPSVERPVAPASGPVRIVAGVWPDFGLMPVSAKDDWVSGWPKRIQRAELARMSELVGARVQRVLKLETAQPGALKVRALEISFNPQRHTAYAVQWFMMSLALLIAYGVYGYRASRQCETTAE